MIRFALMVAALAPCVTASACIRDNPDHCDNNGGHAACGAQTPICSVCVGDNDGCVAGPIEDASCLFGGQMPSSGAGTDAGTSVGDSAGSTTSPSSTSAGTGEVDADGSTSGPPPPSCGDGTVTPPEQCEGDMQTQCDALGLGSGTATCFPDTCLFDARECSTMPVCPNGVREAGEFCDGDDLGGFSCKDLTDDDGNAYIGGELACAGTCDFDEAGCLRCVATGGNCGSDDQCCNGKCGSALTPGRCAIL